MPIVRTTRLHRGTDAAGRKTINGFTIRRSISVGASGKVVVATDDDGHERALKIFSKSLLRKQQRQDEGVLSSPKSSSSSSSPVADRAHVEIDHIARLRSEHIITLFEVIDSPHDDKIILVLEYADIGELLVWNAPLRAYQCSWAGDDHVVAAGSLPWIVPEHLARHCFIQIIEAVRYLHEVAFVCHRDIKPGNILLKTGADHHRRPHILLADFGVARSFANDAAPMYSNTAGTYAFVPPEACTGDAYDGRDADRWALGVTLFAMVFGSLPFYSPIIGDLFAAIEACIPAWPCDSCSSASSGLDPGGHPVLDLLGRMLDRRPDQRPGFEQMLQHPWTMG